MSERLVTAPVLIEGDLLFTGFHSQNSEHNLEVAYHGRPNDASLLTPQIVYWRVGDTLFPDSKEEVVCADDNPVNAVLFALAPRRGLPIGLEPNDNGGVDYWVHRDLKDEFLSATGIICGLDRSAFEVFTGGPPKGYTGSVRRRPPELRATNTQVPLFNMRVTQKDFFALLKRQPCSTFQYC